MRTQSFQKVIQVVIVLSLVAGLLAPRIVSARDKEVCWGGRGFDPTVRNSCRFLAYLYIPKMEVRIRIDTYETFQDVSTLRLIPLQGREYVSKACWKMSRHINSPWECYFPAADIIKLSGLGMVIAENKYGQNLVTDDIDFDEIRSLFHSEDEQESDSYSPDR